jgi:glycosyltransferase involved in cell wall biosynthesis
MKNKISIIIPCYNVEKYIERCIKSILEQSIGLESLELIFVNDASTDSTLSILLEFEKKYSDNILVVDLPENCRQGTARNVGINYASADYIGFVDSDDWIEPNMFERLYSKIQQYNCDAVACRYFIDYPNGKFIGNANGEDSFITSTTAIKDKEISWQIGFSCGVWNTIYRKSLIMDNQIFFPEKLTYEDNYWTSIIRLYVKSFYMLEENLYHYCVNLSSTIQLINSSHHLDRLKIELMKLDTYKEMGIFNIYHDEIELEFLNTFYVNTVHILFTRFDPIPINVIFYIVEYVLDLFPNYKNNPYFINNLTNYHQFLNLLEMNLNEEEWNIIASAYLEDFK